MSRTTPDCLTRACVLILVLTWCGAAQTADLMHLAFAGTRPATLLAPELTLDGPLPASPIAHWLDIKVERGDTLSGLFRQADLEANQWQAILALGDVVDPLLQLHPGDTFRLRKTPDGRLAALHFPLSPTNTLVIRRAANGLTAHIRQLQTTTRQILVKGVVGTSLSASLRQAGVPSRIANALAHIYDTRTDLSKTINTGDRFSIIYNANYIGGSRISNGPIIAANIKTNGESERVFRQVNADGQAQYYDAEGDPYAPSIERTPLNYNVVSSPFDLHRRNPVLGVVRPHTGVDLAAPHGTAVHAAGDGTVTFVGWRSGYGRLIKIKHGGGYTTRYAHLAGFASGLDEGDHVEQDQAIGYVGESGVATGYHLHFEIRKNGEPHNPLTMPLPDGTPLSGPILTAFTSRIQPLIARLSGHTQPATMLAANATASFKACPQSGAINAVLALAPKQVEDKQLSQVFCAIGS